MTHEPCFQLQTIYFTHGPCVELQTITYTHGPCVPPCNTYMPLVYRTCKAACRRRSGQTDEHGGANVAGVDGRSHLKKIIKFILC